MTASTTHFIVVFDDEQGLCCPMGWDPACDGALSATASNVAIFESRGDARSAIRVSKAFAHLCEAQGKPVNTDFTEAISNVKVLTCVQRGNTS